jgi:predicted DNA-binding transcriptional regulator YafY
MQRAEDWVVVFDYTDSQGITRRRVASPIRWLSRDRFLALCLCREEPRQFYLNRCRNVRLDASSQYVMPVELGMVD